MTALGAALSALCAWDFVAATGFIGDDHLFLTYARHAPNPLDAFVTDRHGGEYYRPVPMLLWWVLGRLGDGAALPFALLALSLHVAAALGVAALARAHGQPGAAAGALFLVAPGTREAALWFSASTDLLATTACLGAVLLVLRGTRRAFVLSLACAAIAHLSKESAIVLPGLVAASLWAARPAEPRGARVLAHTAITVLYVAVRFVVLRGLGGAGDEAAPLGTRAVQIAGGLALSLTGNAPLPTALALALGATALGWALLGLRGRGRNERLGALWLAIALAPLPAAGWVVGARYFYLPAAGVALLLGAALARRGAIAAGTAIAFLLAAGTVAAAQRRAQLADHGARVQAAADAVETGLKRGHRLFRIPSGVKDLDLALKNHPRLAARADEFLVLTDVPASFARLPAALASRARFLLAAPPLPPAGAYLFGDARVVGLARAGAAPSHDLQRDRLPELRTIELHRRAGAVAWRDVTPQP